jgi:hypothetical protein
MRGQDRLAVNGWSPTSRQRWFCKRAAVTTELANRGDMASKAPLPLISDRTLLEVPAVLLLGGGAGHCLKRRR